MGDRLGPKHNLVLTKIVAIPPALCCGNVKTIFFSFNMSYLTVSYIVFTLKMESVSKNTNFGLKMTVKSGLEKILLKSCQARDYFPLLHKSAQNHKFNNRNNYLPAWRDFKIFFFTTFHHPF